jgi:arabinan endo-1,5-alpha-L-arabinosidase
VTFFTRAQQETIQRDPIGCLRLAPFNAVDPNVLVGGTGQVWLTFGSRWASIQQLRLDPATGLPLRTQRSQVVSARRKLRTVAARPDGVTIEAPFLVERGGDYDLFVSVGDCRAGNPTTD